jgi:plastocyanin domain-containing protein
MSEAFSSDAPLEITISKKSLMYALLFIVTLSAVIGLAFYKSTANAEPQNLDMNTISNNVSKEGDIQYIDITARGGYRPNLTIAESGKETIIRMKTSNTFDCSLAVSVPKLGYSTYLPQNGTTEIKVPAAEKNSELRGTCSMGMYGFRIKFI